MHKSYTAQCHVHDVVSTMKNTLFTLVKVVNKHSKRVLFFFRLLEPRSEYWIFSKIPSTWAAAQFTYMYKQAVDCIHIYTMDHTCKHKFSQYTVLAYLMYVNFPQPSIQKYSLVRSVFRLMAPNTAHDSNPSQNWSNSALDRSITSCKASAWTMSTLLLSFVKIDDLVNPLSDKTSKWDATTLRSWSSVVLCMIYICVHVCTRSTWINLTWMSKMQAQFLWYL